jgi:hypothetical protein
VEHKTPETQAAYQHEMDLLLGHRDIVSGLTIVGFVFVDILGFYVFWNYGKSTPKA